jgi:hypothetical protein
MNENVCGCEVYLRRYLHLIWTVHFFRNQMFIPVKMYNIQHFPAFPVLSFYFVPCATYFVCLFFTSWFCSYLSMWPPYSCVCTFHTNTSMCSYVTRLLWRSLYWVKGTLYCKNLNRIEMLTTRVRSVRGMCQWKETVACREKILANNTEWLCGVFRLCV